MNPKINEREWLAQQIAVWREQAAPGSGDIDARDRPYRLIARGLREPLPAGLPANFARRMAARAAAAEASRFEVCALIGLMATLAVCAVAMVIRFGGEWMAGPSGGGWPFALAACIGASWLIDQWKRRVS